MCLCEAVCAMLYIYYLYVLQAACICFHLHESSILWCKMLVDKRIRVLACCLIIPWGISHVNVQTQKHSLVQSYWRDKYSFCLISSGFKRITHFCTRSRRSPIPRFRPLSHILFKWWQSLYPWNALILFHSLYEGASFIPFCVYTTSVSDMFLLQARSHFDLCSCLSSMPARVSAASHGRNHDLKAEYLHFKSIFSSIWRWTRGWCTPKSGSEYIYISIFCNLGGAESSTCLECRLSSLIQFAVLCS